MHDAGTHAGSNGNSYGGRAMNRPNQSRSSSQRRRRAKHRASSVDVWHSPAPLPDVVPIEAPRDVAALLRSLGDPPIHGGAAIGHYVHAVAERAAAVAVALALSVDLLAQPTTDDDVWSPTGN